MDLGSLVIHIIVNTIILSPVLWISGRIVVGKEKAKFTDALLTIIIGTVAGVLVGAFFTGIVAAIIQLILWLLIVKHFFDCGWLKALAISILAVIVFIAVVVVLGLIGFTLITFF